MHQLRRMSRTAFLYLTSILLISSVPMAAFADDSDACAGTGHWSTRWETDPVTKQCVKLYDQNGKFVGPSYMAPQPSPVPSPTPSPSPSPQATTSPTDPSTSTAPTTVTDSGNSNATGVDTTTNGTAATTDNNTTGVNVDINSTAKSGDANVKGNQSGGGATSGDADNNATVVNSVHSTVDGGNGAATFTYDIYGNVDGNIVLDGNNGTATLNNTTNLNGTTDVNNKVGLNNNVNVAAGSGDATVSGNESNGNATSGDANAVVNILNLINTIIAANKSFVGTINIHGSLNGDIILSSEFIPQLVASNAGNVNGVSASNLALATNINDDNTIVNNVNLTASSGSATVSGNESSGSATSGMAQTKLTILNLTGHEVDAANGVLVFVNVGGTWIGMIMDAPGATAAMLGGGIVKNDTTNISNVANLANSSSITNNVNVTAISGNAGVSGNESSGNATSGNASASANIANISTSTFNLSNWFMVLYINIDNDWLGSFLVKKDTGEITPLSGMAIPDKSATIAAPTQHFGFVPRTQNIPQNALPGVIAASNSDDANYQTAVLASAVVSGKGTGMTQTMTPTLSPREDPFSVIMMIGGFGIVGISGAMWAVRRIIEARAARSLI